MAVILPTPDTAAILARARRQVRKIVTDFVYPPIPCQQFDWCAYYEGEEELQHYGCGRTEAEAIADLQENYE
jgi:hypothetical protein